MIEDLDGAVNDEVLNQNFLMMAMDTSSARIG